MASKSNKYVGSSIKQKKVKLRKDLEELAKDPKYKDIIEKHRSSLSGILNIVADTTTASAMSEDSQIYTKAELLLEQIVNGEITLGQLSLDNKCCILYYLERYNNRVGRILDILTRIPLSSIKLQKPKTRYSIVNDYVLKKFNSFFESAEFQIILEKAVRHYWLFSFASVLIEDDFEYVKGSTLLDDFDVNRDLATLKNINENSTDKSFTQDELDAIDGVYRKTPQNVSATDRLRFLKQILLFHSPAYRGPVRVTLLPVLSTITREENLDINYFIYKVNVSENMIKTLENLNNSLDWTEDNKEELIKQAQRVGYSRSKCEAYFKASEEGVFQGDSILVDTDPFNTTGMYVATFQRNGLATKDNSVFNRVLSDVIDLVISNKRLREKTNRGFKKDILVTTSEMEDEAKINDLQNHLTNAANNDEGTFVVTNMQVNVQDMDLNVNANLDLTEQLERSNQNISEGVGIPESLITDSVDAYSNSFLKALLLENEFITFRVQFKKFLEKVIFEPIAIKYGFLMKDEWGDMVAIYPQVAFNRLSLARGSDDLAALMDLATEGKMSMETIYEALGFDPDDIKVNLRKEQTTILNDGIREAFNQALSDMVGKASSSDVLSKELETGLDIPDGTLTPDSESESAF